MGKETGMDVAVLGMGRMGRALAGRLLDGGHRVTVWNRSKGKAGEVVSAGAREADGVADAVEGVDVAITMLANDDAVSAVAFGQLRPSIGEKTGLIIAGPQDGPARLHDIGATLSFAPQRLPPGGSARNPARPSQPPSHPKRS
jgi:Trk K+ transport system NAD-binding subunit